jgi:hypothetical protein
MRNNKNIIDEHDYSVVDAEEAQLFRIRKYKADRALIINIGITMLFIVTAKYIFYIN